MNGPSTTGGAGAVGLLGAAYRARRYALLFYSLLLSLAVAPILASLHLDAGVLDLFLFLNILLAATGADGVGQRRFLVAVAVAAAFRLAAHLLGSAGIDEGNAFALAALMLAAALGALLHALRSHVIDKEHIYAALSAYLLVGQFFGILASALERLVPGSYTGAVLGPAGALPLPRAIYFSFVTLATLGYGDIVPATDVARGLAVVEAVAGQLYIAVLVARLVAGYEAHGRDERRRHRGTEVTPCLELRAVQGTLPCEPREREEQGT